MIKKSYCKRLKYLSKRLSSGHYYYILFKYEMTYIKYILFTTKFSKYFKIENETHANVSLFKRITKILPIQIYNLRFTQNGRRCIILTYTESKISIKALLF